MDAIKRANFASKQTRAGPAPLASFEDLPSDELESPEDSTQVPMHTSSALDESDSGDLQFTTPDSLTVSSQSTPRIECDFDSHFTLTPGDPYEGQTTSELRTTSLSSLSKESTLNVKQKKGSALSLGTYETPEPESNLRKSSWTDIFRSHNQNSAKSTSSVFPSADSANEKHSKKKSRSEVSKKDASDSKQKEKGKFLSLFKKKSNKNISSSLSPGEFPIENLSTPQCIQNLTEDIVPPKVTNGSISKGKENELPKDIELCPTVIEVQNDLGKVNPERNEKIPDERKINRKLINISETSFEKEYNILSRQDEEKQLDKMSKTENIQAIVDEVEHESSESELVFEEKDTISEKKEDDFEAENLIPQDSSELEEESIEIQPIAIGLPKQVVIPSRQQRLEVTTKPIDRPRSTTPINVAPLEAFIQSVSPTFVSRVEKIKLSLPGEQFVGRVKSPKKSSARSWADFCESGLHSPRMHKRTDSEEQADPFSDGATFPSDVPFTESDSNWAAFESNFQSSESNGFRDNFTATENGGSNLTQELMSGKFSDPYQPFETNFSVPCSCMCHAYGCLSCDESNRSEQSTTMQSSMSSVMKTCACKCHHQSNALNEVDKSTLLSDSLKSHDAANVFDSLNH